MISTAALSATLRDRLSVVRLTPFDPSTPDGRGRERNRRVALTAIAAAFAKAMSVATALISIPMTLNYLGTERFGMWMTISSLIAMLGFADFGIANGVLSAVAAAHGKDDRAGIARVVSSGFFLLTGIASLILCVFALIYPWMHWAQVFNVSGSLAIAEAGPTLAVFIACFAAAVPLTVVQRVQMGLQLGFLASLWQCVGSLFGLFGVLLAIHLQGGLPYLVLALAGAPLFASILNGLHFYFRSHPEFRPRWRLMSRRMAQQVAGTGSLFFVLQVAVAFAYTSDSIVIAQLLGASAVAQYAVPEKLFGLISLVLGMVLAPLWPAYGEAISRGDAAWVRRTLIRSTLTGISIAAVASAMMLLAAPMILRLWVGHDITVPISLLVALAIWRVVEVAGNSIGMFLNGARVVMLQVPVALVTAAVALGLKIVLVHPLGIAGSVWATIIAYILCAAIPYAVFVPRLAVLVTESGHPR